MVNNTLKHISDEAQYVKFDPDGSNFPDDVVDVQAALAALDEVAVDGVPGATTIIPGILRIATQQEVDDGLDNNTAVTPATLAVRIGNPQASTTVIGLTRYATDSEAIDGTIADAAIVPTSLKATIDDVFTNRVSTESANGVIRISSVAAAQAGVDDTTAMTPKKVQLAIAKATAVLPVYGPATESILGTVRIATNGQVAQGTLRDGYAVSPSGLASLTSTETRRGIVRAATNVETAAGTLNDAFVSPASLLARTGTDSRIGLLKVTRTAGVGDANTALAYNADVLHLRGGQSVAGITTFGTANATAMNIGGRQVATVDMIQDALPVGTILMWPSNTLPRTGRWAWCDGGMLSRTGEAALFAVIGGTFGVNATQFAKPDMRGLFVRGVGKSAVMNAQSANDSKGQMGLGAGCGNATLGQVSPQAVRRHKHNSGWGEHHNRGDAYFGATVRNGFRGNKSRDSDNFLYFTNDGTETEADNIRDTFGTLNSAGLIGNENRPWSIALQYIIKLS